MHDMQYITRQGKGWLVRLERCHSVTDNSKTFFDSQYSGGQEGALAAAKVWRDRRLEEAGNVQPYIRHKNRANTSGFIGVSLEAGRNWRAIFNIEKKQRQRSYAIERYGACEAFRLACRKRYEMTGELRQVLEDPDVPCKPDIPIIICYTPEQRDENGPND